MIFYPMVDPFIHGGVQLLGANEWRPMSPDMKKGGPANGAMNGAMRLGGKSRKNWGMEGNSRAW